MVSLPDLIFNTPFIIRSQVHPDIVLRERDGFVVVSWRDPADTAQQWQLSSGSADAGWTIVNVSTNGVLAGGDAGGADAIVVHPASSYDPSYFNWKGDPDGEYCRLSRVTNHLYLNIRNFDVGTRLIMGGEPNQLWHVQPVAQVEQNPSIPEVAIIAAVWRPTMLSFTQSPNNPAKQSYFVIRGNQDSSCTLVLAVDPAFFQISEPAYPPTPIPPWDPACLWTLERWREGVSFRNKATGRRMAYVGNGQRLVQTDTMSLSALFTVLDAGWENAQLMNPGFAFQPSADSNQAIAVHNEKGWTKWTIGDPIWTTSDWSGDDNFDKKWALLWTGRAAFAINVQNGWPNWQ